MSFARPELLWLALALPALVAAGVLGHGRRRRRVARLLGESHIVRRLGAGDLFRFPARRLLLAGLAAASLGLAAAGPRWGTRMVEAHSRSLDLVLALDVSKSMLARDVKPDRLARERLLVRQLLRELRGERVGLVAFSGRAYVLSPLTTDHGALQLYLDALDPEIVSQGGSSLAAALRQSTDLIGGRDPDASRADRAVVLVTDGEALEDEEAVIGAARRAAGAGVVVHVVGIGTTEGAPVPEPDPASGRILGYKRDLSGEVVVSRRNDSLLERIARETGGRFVRADRAGAVERLLSALSGMERATSEGMRRVEPRERFTWFVALALLLLALDTVLVQRETAARQRRQRAAEALEPQEA